MPPSKHARAKDSASLLYWC